MWHLVASMGALCMACVWGPALSLISTTSQRLVQFLLTGNIESMLDGFSEDLFPEIFTKFHQDSWKFERF